MRQTAQPNIYKLYIIKLSKWLMLTMPILFLFYKENGLSTHDLFVLKAVYSASIVVFEIPSGYFGDLFGRKTSLILGSFLGFAGFTLYCFTAGFWSFFICEIILGIGQSFISGSDSALLYDTLKESKREKEYTKIEGRILSIGNFAEAAAAPVGVLIATISLRTTFYFQAAVAFSAIPAALTLVEPERLKIRSSQNATQVFKIIRYALIEHSALKMTILYSSVIGTATLTMAWLIQPYFVFLSLPLAFYGIVIPLLNLTTGVVSMHAYRLEKKFRREHIILFIAIGISSGYFLMGMCHTFLGLVFLFIFYMIRGVATPTLKNHINAVTPSAVRATVLSIRSLIIRLSFVFLGPVLGWHADTFGLPYAIITGAAFFMVSGLISALLLNNTFKKEYAGTVPPTFLNAEQ